ncbi:MAG: hypothetical protein GXP26_04565 [Planctomycetes bacterium]|nr:hypothetical protein [Planctomycetota bacterium]
MSEFSQEYEQPAIEQLESIVRSASGYLQPTDDLRPNALEAARDACRQRRTNRRLGGLAILVLLVAATGFPDFLLSSYPGVAAVQSSELHRRAARSVAENGTETNWALYEAFTELRREHSALLNPSD